MYTVTLTTGDVAAATAGEILQGSPLLTIGGISIDSRKLAPGDFFVAIRGERFDGPVLALYTVRDVRLARAQMFYFDTPALVEFLARASGRAA